MATRLAGKCGIITAAASGMGRAGAELFASEGAGIAIVDRDEERSNVVAEAIRAAGGNAIPIVGDLTDMAFARDAVAQAAAALGGLDFLWNHAGHPGPSAFENMDWSVYELAMALNLSAPIALTAAAIPHMRERGGGSIVFTSSGAGIVASPFSPVYSAAKFAVVGLCRALAKRYGNENIRCNALCPGVIDTPMLRQFMHRPDAPDTGVDVDDMIERFGGTNPMLRNGEPEEVARVAMFLVSGEASYVNGAVLTVDGGQTA